ncbi:GNAT family N-acetyltransferase [Clostridium neonatale]|uniref:GNAT family N-acetyltransferase n=1 Tax=Clostridium neonatale TaxID=137838 RepID=UPI00374F8C82
MVDIENINLRLEEPKDYKEVENLTREAFWNVYIPGCDEHYIIHIMRKSDAFIKELDIVAELGDKIVGNIVYSKAKILCDDKTSYNDVICFGPISVLPEFQNREVGGRLIEHSKEVARKLGYRGILIYGDPDYYKRYGFVPAENYEIGTPDDMYSAPLQAFELYNGALKNCKGRFFEDGIFEVDREKADEFEKGFPKKEKSSDLPSQKRFIELINMRKPRK